MPKSPSTPKSGTSRVQAYDPFYCTQSSANILDSSSPALAPVTPLVLPPKKAVRSDPKTAGQLKTIEEDEDKDDAAKEKEIDKLVKILEKDSKYVEWKEKAQYMRDHFKVRAESEEVRAKMGVAYKKWSVSGESGLMSPEHFLQVKFLLEKFNEHFCSLDEELFSPFFKFTEHDLEVHSMVSPALFDVWAAFASDNYRSAVDDWAKQNGKDFKRYMIYLLRHFVDDGTKALERACLEYQSFAFDFKDVAATFVEYHKALRNLEQIRG